MSRWADRRLVAGLLSPPLLRVRPARPLPRVVSARTLFGGAQAPVPRNLRERAARRPVPRASLAPRRALFGGAHSKFGKLPVGRYMPTGLKLTGTDSALFVAKILTGPFAWGMVGIYLAGGFLQMVVPEDVLLTHPWPQTAYLFGGGVVTTTTLLGQVRAYFKAVKFIALRREVVVQCLARSLSSISVEDLQTLPPQEIFDRVDQYAFTFYSSLAHENPGLRKAILRIVFGVAGKRLHLVTASTLEKLRSDVLSDPKKRGIVFSEVERLSRFHLQRVLNSIIGGVSFGIAVLGLAVSFFFFNLFLVDSEELLAQLGRQRPMGFSLSITADPPQPQEQQPQQPQPPPPEPTKAP